MRIRKSFIIGIIVTLLLLIGAVVAYYLSQRPQDVRQRAAEPTSSNAFGKAAVFSAVNPATAPVTSNNIVTHDKNFTLEFWIKPTNVTDVSAQGVNIPLIESVLPQETTACQDKFTIMANRISATNTYAINAIILPFGVNGAGLTSASHPVTFNEWTNVTLTLNNTTHVAKLFINGAQTDAKAIGQVFCSDLGYEIGYEVAEGGGVLKYVGDLDELRLSDSIRYDTDYTPRATPFTPDANTLALWHFDNNLLNEFDNIPLNDPSGAITYIDSTIGSVSSPVCQGTISTCSWDAVNTAVSYHYKIIEEGKDTPIAESDIQAPATSTSFTSEANKTYTCEVTATSACGTGAKGSATATCSVPTGTPTPTSTPSPTPSSTPTPTATGTPPPTPTGTPIPTNTLTPTPTSTPVPPTGTPIPPTATLIPPTATLIPVATDTPVPGVPTNSPTPTLSNPGSPIETLTITSGIILTILGALILFAL